MNTSYVSPQEWELWDQVFPLYVLDTKGLELLYTFNDFTEGKETEYSGGLSNSESSWIAKIENKWYLNNIS